MDNPVQDPAKARPATADPKRVTIRISLNASKELQVDKAVPPPRIQAGGLLTFEIDPADQDLESFVILMNGPTPFGSGDPWSGGKKGWGSQGIRIDGRANNPNNDPGTTEFTYSYCVMASDGTNSYYMDPDVVVGPQGTT